MAGFMNRLKAGIAAVAAASAAGSYQVEGRQVTCPHCGGQQFDAGPALLDTRASPLVELDWAKISVHTLKCAECSRIEWFGQCPERL
jgi:hypothetical protein